jgi:hypothetical protein
MFGTNGEEVAGEFRILLVKGFIMCNFRRVLAYKRQKIKGDDSCGTCSMHRRYENLFKM